MRAREGWERLSQPGDKCRAHWRHTASGWEVFHCGHPTANWPYYATQHGAAAHRSRFLLMGGMDIGLAFPNLLSACIGVELWIAGKGSWLSNGSPGAPYRRTS